MALLAESEGIGDDQDSQQQADDLDGLFDNDNEEEEEYKDGVEEEGQDVGTEGTVLDLFGDVDDIENEEKDTKGKESGGKTCESLDRSKEDLQGLCWCAIMVFGPAKRCFLGSPVELYVFLHQTS